MKEEFMNNDSSGFPPKLEDRPNEDKPLIAPICPVLQLGPQMPEPYHSTAKSWMSKVLEFYGKHEPAQWYKLSVNWDDPPSAPATSTPTSGAQSKRQKRVATSPLTYSPPGTSTKVIEVPEEDNDLVRKMASGIRVHLVSKPDCQVTISAGSPGYPEELIRASLKRLGPQATPAQILAAIFHQKKNYNLMICRVNLMTAQWVQSA